MTEKKYGIFMLGGTGKVNCLQFNDMSIKIKQQMSEKSFFSAVYLKGMIYIFGGYDNYEKMQLKSCESYNIEKDEWKTLDVTLNTARSQSSSCIFNDNSIYICGGFNKEIGTLATVEKYNIKSNTITIVDVQMPSALRRFASMKISSNKILLIGGMERLNTESDAVFCFDIEEDDFRIEKLDKIDRAGVIDFPVVVDSVGNLHLFLENASGTSPPYDVVYSFLEYS
jgi:hypothetical protein